jgi:hypothetical protein
MSKVTDFFKTIGINKSQVLITVLVAFFALVAGGYWLVQRVAIGTYRHALNHPEMPKDPLWLQIHNGCKSVEGAIWLNKGHPNYVPDRLANSNEIYRYLVFDEIVLSDPTCLRSIVDASRRAPYKVSIAIAGLTRNATYLYFSPKEN